MIVLKRKEAFERAVKAFGPWSGWGRAEHVAYGLIRGVEYSRMERCSNDNPHAWPIVTRLRDLGAWPEEPMPEAGKYRSVSYERYKEVGELVKWVRKEPRVKREHVPGVLAPSEAAQ